MLSEDLRKRIQSTLRSLLSTRNPDGELVEITEDLPFEVTQFNITHYVDHSFGFELFVNHSDDVTLVTDDVVDCVHHAEGHPLSTLAELGENYEALEKDLLETIAVMVDLPEHPDDRERHLYGDLAFTNTCYDVCLIFTFLYDPGKHIRGIYQDAAF